MEGHYKTHKRTRSWTDPIVHDQQYEAEPARLEDANTMSQEDTGNIDLDTNGHQEDDDVHLQQQGVRQWLESGPHQESDDGALEGDMQKPSHVNDLSELDLCAIIHRLSISQQRAQQQIDAYNRQLQSQNDMERQRILLQDLDLACTLLLQLYQFHNYREIVSFLQPILENTRINNYERLLPCLFRYWREFERATESGHRGFYDPQPIHTSHNPQFQQPTYHQPQFAHPSSSHSQFQQPTYQQPQFAHASPPYSQLNPSRYHQFSPDQFQDSQPSKDFPEGVPTDVRYSNGGPTQHTPGVMIPQSSVSEHSHHLESDLQDPEVKLNPLSEDFEPSSQK